MDYRPIVRALRSQRARYRSETALHAVWATVERIADELADDDLQFDRDAFLHDVLA